MPSQLTPFSPRALRTLAPPHLRLCYLHSPHHSRRHASAGSTKPTKLPQSPVRTRFAPSPTGRLHLGSLRTALFNYLLAHRTSGSFLLRLEDTDAKRTVPGAEEALYKDLQWAGLQWDEGPLVGGERGPYRQSERTELYRDAAERLVQAGGAYRCFCKKERLEALRTERAKLGLPADYDRLCAGIDASESAARAAKGEQHIVRLRSPAAYPPFMDLVYGTIGRGGTGANAGVVHKLGEVAYEDPVLLKSDGLPTYHLANVVDDHEMGITHVVRATEWISSTPKHLALYQAFGWTPPSYAHVGLLVDGEGRKLSKRAMDAGIDEFRASGWLKQVVVNFAALLGCSYSRRDEVMELEELVQEFEMRFTRGNAVVTEEKLVFLQRAHAERAIKQGDENETLKTIIEDMVTFVEQQQNPASLIAPAKQDLPKYIRTILTHDPRNYIRPNAFYNRNRYLLTSPPLSEIANATARPDVKEPSTNSAVWPHATFIMLRESLSALQDWKPKDISETIRATAQEMPDKLVPSGALEGNDERKQRMKVSELFRWLRQILVAGDECLGMAPAMYILGREETLRRLTNACAGV